MHHVTKALVGTSVAGGVAGVVVGGAISAAKQAEDVKNGKITKEQAAKKTAKDAASAGVATAVGVAAVSMLRFSGLFGLVAVFAITAGTKYLIDNSASKACKSKS